MRKRQLLISTLFVVAAILAIVATKVDIKRKKNIDSYYKVVNTCLNTQLVTVNNDLVSQRIQKEGMWEFEVTKCILENIKPSDVVVEIGANIGYYTTIIADILKRGSGKLIAYEANEEVYRLAQVSLLLNNSESKVQLKNLAVSDKEGEIEFSYYAINPKVEMNLGAAHLTIQDDFGQKTLKQRMVKCVSLDEDLADIPSIDVLRMDIEGSEALALKGAKKLIERSPNLKIIMEWFPSAISHYCDVDMLIKELRGYGFDFYDIEGEFLDNGEMQKLSDDQLKKIGLTNVLLKREK